MVHACACARQKRYEMKMALVEHHATLCAFSSKMMHHRSLHSPAAPGGAAAQGTVRIPMLNIDGTIRRPPRPLSVMAAQAATDRLTKSDLVQYMADGCKPRDAWRCGLTKLSGKCEATSAVRAALCIAGPESNSCLQRPGLSLRRIGTEHEKLGYTIATKKRLTYEQIEQLLRSIQARFNWDPIMEGAHIIGLQQDGQSITLEPGGQFELSGAAVDTLHKTCAEVNSHLYQVRVCMQ